MMNAFRQIKIAQQRIEICLSCEYLDHNDGSCKECICDAYNKVRIMGSACPLNKWEEVDWMNL